MEHHAHDKFAKAVFSDRKVFIDFVQQLCPPGIASEIDYGTIRLVDNGHVSQTLSENYADLFYECRLLNGHRAFVIFLLENKTDVPKFPQVQLMGYMHGRYEKAILKRVKKLPLVIPIILYHGRRRWPDRPFSECFEAFPAAFGPFVPQLNYILIDLSKIPDDALLGLRPTRLVNALVTMKHCYEPEYLKNNPDIIFRLGGKLNATDSGKIFLAQLIQYFLKMTQFSPIEKQSFIENKIDPIMQRKFKSTWDMLLEEGMEKGMEKGKLAQLKLTIRSLMKLTPDISDEEISIITCAELETIQQIRLEIEAEKG